MCLLGPETKQTVCLFQFKPSETLLCADALFLSRSAGPSGGRNQREATVTLNKSIIGWLGSAICRGDNRIKEELPKPTTEFRLPSATVTANFLLTVFILILYSYRVNHCYTN